MFPVVHLEKRLVRLKFLGVNPYRHEIFFVGFVTRVSRERLDVRQHGLVLIKIVRRLPEE